MQKRKEHSRMAAKKVLIVEDEQSITSPVKDKLEQCGFEVDSCIDGIEGYETARRNRYDAIVMDIMLPQMDGIEITKRLRQDGIETPIIMCTAIGGLDDKLKGFDAGADDYLPKPFYPTELVARIGALIRRNSMLDDGLVHIGDLTYNEEDKTLSCKGDSITLSDNEHGIFVELARAYRAPSKDNRIVKKHDLLERVWGDKNITDENNVEAYVSFLRKKLRYFESDVQIKTIRGVGYQFAIDEV